jgi:gamma-glutamylcyclotransferase (GGCT)/AIG2-like uncharacterized protein YtfP
VNKGELLFVYGSLRRGERADLSNNMRASFICPDRINGLLYSVSWFPGLKEVPDIPAFDYDAPSVVGDVFRLRDDTIIKQLDAYEGYPDLYERLQTVTESGRKVWVYVYNHGVHEDSRVKSGDWTSANPVNRATVA